MQSLTVPKMSLLWFTLRFLSTSKFVDVNGSFQQTLLMAIECSNFSNFPEQIKVIANIPEKLIIFSFMRNF